MTLRTSADLAEQLDIPEATPAQWRWRGVGPRYIKVGRHVRYRQEDIDAWLVEQTVATNVAP